MKNWRLISVLLALILVLGLIAPWEASKTTSANLAAEPVGLVTNAIFQTGNCVQPQTGMVSWWPLEGNANDVRGSNHGVLSGAPAFTTGRIAQALRFDGTNDHVRVPASFSLNVGTSSGFTLAAWIQPDDNLARPVLEYNNENINQTRPWGAHIWVNTNGLVAPESPGTLFVNIHDTADTSHVIRATNTITAGVFQHIALTYDKTSGVARLYVNGVEKNGANIGSFTPQTSYPLFMGYRPAGLDPSIRNNRFKGIIDEAQLFNRALSASEIQGIACAEPKANLAISKSVSSGSPTVNSTLTYPITVSNSGPDAASSVVVTDNLPPTTTFVSCASTGGGVCGGSGANRTVTFNSLASGASATITIVARVNCAVANNTAISNTATIVSATSDPVPTNNSATATSTALNPAAISPTSRNFSASGGSASVSVTQASGCPWTATSNATWIRITSGGSGTGNGAVNYTVDPNTSTSSRAGAMTIAGQTFTVTQAGAAPCTFTISPTSQSFTASGGAGSVNVAASQSNCSWTATSNAAWIRITSGGSGTGSGAVNYTVDPNTSASSRTGAMTIAGQTFTVNQAGASGGPIIRIEPTTLNFNVPGPGGNLAQQTLAQQPTPNRSTSASSSRPEIDEEEAGMRREYWEWFYRQRRYPFDQIPEGARMRAWELQQQLREQMNALAPQISATQWTTIGPGMTVSDRWGNVTGRVTSLIAHPSNPNTVYIGAAQGGVWRTTDGGATWTPLTDRQPSLAIGSLAFDPGNPNIIYAATGEQNFSGDSYYGNGILKTTDGGANWTVLGATTFARQEIGKLAVHPTNGQIIFAAASNGLMRTTNGGASWTRVLSGATNVATDVLFAPGNPNTLYGAILRDGIYRSTDGGANWVKLANGLPATGIFRAHLAISSANPNTLAAVFTTDRNTSYRLEGVYRTADGGASWTKTAATPTDIFGGQGFYNVFITMHPANANILFVGGIDVARTTDGGATWTNATRSYQGGGVHPDQHALAFSPQNASTVWLGNDGGVWRSDDVGSAWTNLNNGLVTMQFQSIALHPTDNSITYGGTQDNGTQKSGGAPTWNEIFGGDGGATIVDFSNPQTVFLSYVFLKIGKSLDGGANVIYPVINGIPLDSRGNVADRTGFYSPYAMDPTNSQRLAAGTYRVYYTTNGADNWTNISDDLTGGGFISAITFGSNGARIWTGSSDAQIWRGDLAGGNWSWTNATKAPLPNRYITRIAAHPSDPQTAYVSYAGFDTTHIFKTADGGATWTNASAGIPDIPVNVVLLDPNNPNLVYAGTDIGVYRSTDQGASWTIYGENLPNSAVFDMAISKTTGVLRAATHGRGAWEIQTSGEQSFTIFNDGNAPLRITGVTKQNNAAWLQFTPPSPIPFEIAPGASAQARVSVNTAGLSPGPYADRLLVTSNDTARSPYPNGVFINLTVGGGGGGSSCSFTITPTSQSVTAGGGSGTVNVATLSECAWTAASNVSWIVITSGGSGAGSGAVNFMVAANPGSARSGTMTIARQTFTVTQSGGSNCTFTISPTSQSFAANGGAGSVNVNTASGCNWTAQSNRSWIEITSGSNGSGAGAVGFTVAANTGATTRTGAMTIAGQTFTVTQAGGSSCAFTLNPDFADARASGGAGSFNVATQSGCYWTAASLDDWITVTSAGSGVGAGTVRYLVAASDSSFARFSEIEVAGEEFFAIRQVGTGRNCTITPISIGQTVNAALTTSDCFSPVQGEDIYADLYSFSAAAGQQVGITLNSSQFDTYLTLVAPDGSILMEDFGGGGGRNSRIPPDSGFITLPMSGTYLIEASSFDFEEVGGYVLHLFAPAGCAYAISPGSQTFAANGGAGSVTVTAQSGCNWTAASNVSWIVINSGNSGAGNGAVNFIVAANPGASSRTGTMTVAGQTFTVTQAGNSNCTFSISPTSQSFSSAGGNGGANVTAPAGCNWTAASNEGWITITSGVSGSGNGTISFAVAANPGSARIGTLTIAGQTFTVTQAGAANCNYSLNPTSQSFTAAGGAGSFNVAAPSGCDWTATSDSAWITFPIGTGFGSGNGAVSFLVAANAGLSSRTATINVGGQSFTVTQTGSQSSGNCIPPPPGMAGWWPGDGAANDIQGANPGALQNGATFAAGQVGQAFSFDGTDDYVSTNLDAQPSAMPSTTWDAWVFPTRVNHPFRQGIMSIDTGGFARSVLIEAGTANFGVFTGTGVWQPAPVTLNQWQHIAVVYTPTGIRFYKNGVEFIFNGGPNTTGTSGRFTIGRFPGFTQYFQGRIDEVEVFNRALSQTEIQAIFNAGSAGKCKTATPGCPTVSGINPTSGSTGTSATITGANFTGVTAVRFSNNVAAQFTINSDTQITATVPNGAVTGPITINKPNCPEAQTGVFTVMPTGPCIAVSIPTNLSASPGGALTVPINVSDTTGKGALSYDAVLAFDPALLRLQNPAFDRAGTLSANLNVTISSPSPGRLNISGFSSSPLAGAGVLLYLKFDVGGPLNACSDLNWTSFRFNEGAPCSTVSNGRACATGGGGSIAGAISFCASSPSKPVPGVAITASGSPQGSATTDSAGAYQLSNLGAGPYTLTPTKTGDANGITSFDAARIAQHVVGAITLNECQRAAADTSGNGEITSFDAAFIAQYVVGITNPDNRTGTWKFVPPSRAYTSLSGNQTAQNFDAVLVGELTGNWMAGGGNVLLAGQSLLDKRDLSPAQVAISLPQISAATGSSVTIPITVGDLTGRNFLSFDFDLTYDSSVLQAQPQPTDAVDTLARNLTITANATPGRLRVSGFGAQPMSGAGTLLKLKFNVTGASGTGTALAWQRFLFNETAQTNLVNGRVNAANAVTSVSAASFLGESLAVESIVAAFGAGMATRVEVASTLPLPTQLAGTTVRVRDGAGVERLAPLFFVAPTQINFLIPPGTMTGQALVTVTSGDGTVSSGSVSIATVAPGFFTANASGQGVPAATVLRVKADGAQINEPLAVFDPARNQFVAAPIDLGPESDQVFLILFGTGWRWRSSLAATTVSIGGVNSEVLYAGEQGAFVGLDQLNLRLPRSLAGRGEVEVVLIVDGRPANRVRINVR